MKIILITLPPGRIKTNLPFWVEKLRQKQHPLGLSIIASRILHDFPTYEVKISDYYSYSKYTIDNVVNEILDENVEAPIDVIGISASSFLLKQVYLFTKIIKDRLKNIKIIIGGAITNHYIDELKDQKLFDAIFIKNSNLSIIDYLKNINNVNKPTVEGYFKYCDGIYEGTKPSINFIIESIRNEVSINYEKLFCDNFQYCLECEESIGSMITSYGCYYQCKFCSESGSQLPGKGGLRSIQTILKEIEILEKLNYKRISILNDSFLNEDPSRIKKIINRIRNGNFKFEIRARVDQINRLGKDKMLWLLESGLIRIFIGVECFNSDALKFLSKQINVNDIKKCFEIVNNCKNEFPDISTVAYIMLGLRKNKNGKLKKESIIDCIKSIWAPIMLKVDMAHYAQLIIYPGTKLNEEYIEETSTNPWKLFYCDPTKFFRPPFYRYFIDRSLLVSLGYFVFFIRPKYWKKIIKIIFNRIRDYLTGLKEFMSVYRNN